MTTRPVEFLISPAELKGGWELVPVAPTEGEWFEHRDRDRVWYKHCSQGLLRERWFARGGKELRLAPEATRPAIGPNPVSPATRAMWVRRGQWRQVTVATTAETIAAQVLFEMSCRHPGEDWSDLRWHHWRRMVEMARRELRGDA